MKRLSTVFLALVLLLCLSLAMASCQMPVTPPDDEPTAPVLPDGYQWYNGNGFSFAYPEDWAKQDGGVAVLADTLTGNNVTVTYEAKTDVYDTMDNAAFESMMKPLLEQMGMSVSNSSVAQVENDAGLGMTKIAYTATANGVSMAQTMFVFAVGDYNYVVTVTEMVSDPTLVANVFNTISLVK